MFKGQLPWTCVDREPVHVLPELSNGVDWLLRLERESTDLVVDEAGDHLELHGTVVAKVHVLKEIAVGRAIQPEKQGGVCVCMCLLPTLPILLYPTLPILLNLSILLTLPYITNITINTMFMLIKHNI